ncbi:inner membrane protein [Sinobacterium caligoides]|uniref:Inner membrane protein n=1 Tax=Sinobacterium caligoides TaxID=933926 RepID=A0A3N2DK42_9GAMM|nr:YgjV family protein [Sinobacterium caligoides]ROS00174.1 inner membrane protein [Sinobacterium caligoides]
MFGLTNFELSQCLITVAIGFDIMSFQFKRREAILACLTVSVVFISVHFYLLGNMTAALLVSASILRNLVSIFSTSKYTMSFFVALSSAVTALTYSGILSIVALLGTSIQTVAAFSKTDKRVRILMMIGTSVWLAHNYFAGSPAAVLMETIFLSSNIIAYYRFYIREARAAINNRAVISD